MVMVEHYEQVLHYCQLTVHEYCFRNEKLNPLKKSILTQDLFWIKIKNMNKKHWTIVFKIVKILVPHQ